jgi:hypothetical protein
MQVRQCTDESILIVLETTVFFSRVKKNKTI